MLLIALIEPPRILRICVTRWRICHTYNVQQYCHCWIFAHAICISCFCYIMKSICLSVLLVGMGDIGQLSWMSVTQPTGSSSTEGNNEHRCWPSSLSFL